MKRNDDSELHEAIDVLRRMLPVDEIERDDPSSPQTVFTGLTTVWLMIMQRLGGGLSMQAVLKQALEAGSPMFPDCKRVQNGTLSERDTAFCDARKRIELKTFTKLIQRVSTSIIRESAPGLSRFAYIIDGTTLTTEPTRALKDAFPPAINQHGESVWPVVQLLVAHEMNSGCALEPEVGAMYGSKNTSESKMFTTLCGRLPNNSVLLADAGFGKFGPVYDAVRSGHSLAFRMTKSQHNSLLKKASELPDDAFHEDVPGCSRQVAWKPTKSNRKTREDLPEDVCLDVVIHEIPVRDLIDMPDNTKVLYLVTTPDIHRREAIALYQRRYDVEHDIRDVKVTLNTENIRARTEDTFRKELLASLVAYNLVIQFRRQAAAIADVPPRRLSFTGVWDTFRFFVSNCQSHETSNQWLAKFERALQRASRALVRNRPNRSFPRAAHPRRPKTTKWQKQQRKKDSNSQSLKPPD